jgi:hypothetical protein
MLSRHAVPDLVHAAPHDTGRCGGHAETVDDAISTLTAAVSGALAKILVGLGAVEAGRDGSRVAECIPGRMFAGENGLAAGTNAATPGVFSRDDRRPASGTLVGRSRTVIDRAAEAVPE